MKLQYLYDIWTMMAHVLQVKPNSTELIKKDTLPFICIDGTEIALANVCDGLAHCTDSSDETMKLCHHIVCPPATFRCAYGACILRSKRCNGFMDCIDGSDELFCDKDSSCGNEQFHCSKSSECISFSLICDGFKDCADGSDENSTICNDYTCSKHTLKCNYGGCVHQEVVCDGLKDCIDGSDEREDLCVAVHCKGNDCKQYSCKDNEFGCESGDQCVPLSKVCDGTHQCRDASDEKVQICKNRSCDRNQFRCDYGACIPSNAKCDSRVDCHDWSDEAETTCGKSLPRGACRLPAAKPGTQYVISNCERCRPGDVVPELTSLNYTCDGNKNIEGKNIIHCQRNRWLPAIPICPNTDNTIKCPLISSPGAIKRCEMRWGVKAGQTSCNQTLPVGTRILMECRSNYERVRGSSRITCLHDGTWSQVPLSCQPTCGVRIGSSIALIVNGWIAPFEEPLPWHATIFSRDNGIWAFICGGTLIAESIILTAAHCVWKITPTSLKVILASNSSDFANQNKESQKLDVHQIKIQNSYQDQEGNYNSDIAILILKNPASINSRVLPACMDWSNKFELNQRHYEIGIIAGMGATENDTFSPTLRLVTAQAIPPEVCRLQMKRNFRKYLTYTSFCAGWANGTSVCNGDSGGGFLLKRPNSDIWEIHGVVSLSPRRIGVALCDPQYYTVFTKVSVYLNWIKEIVQSVPVSEGLSNYKMRSDNDSILLSQM